MLHISLDNRDEKLSILGSWVCTHLVEVDNNLFQHAHIDILKFLQNGTHQSSLRNWMKVLTHVNIDEEYQGLALDLCTQFISDNTNKVALQVYSIQVITKLIPLYPEIYSEIKSLLELHAIEKSPAYHASVRLFLKKTKKYSTL